MPAAAVSEGPFAAAAHHDRSFVSLSETEHEVPSALGLRFVVTNSPSNRDSTSVSSLTAEEDEEERVTSEKYDEAEDISSHNVNATAVEDPLSLLFFFSCVCVVVVVVVVV